MLGETGEAMSGGEMIGGLLEKSKELGQLRKEQDETLLAINRILKKLQYAPELVENSRDNTLSKLRHLYGHAKALSENEASTSHQLLTQLDALLQSGFSAAQRKKIEVSEQKKMRLKSDADISRFTPAASMRSQLEQLASLKGEQTTCILLITLCFMSGRSISWLIVTLFEIWSWPSRLSPLMSRPRHNLVAARITNDDAEKDEWIVMKVIHFDKDTKEFEVLDEEPGDEEESVQRKYKLLMARIIPFPKRGEPSSTPDFPPGKHVLAVYPGTTALYKATVVNHRKRKADDYLLEFDDDEEAGSLPQRNVPFHKVVPLPEGHRQ